MLAGDLAAIGLDIGKGFVAVDVRLAFAKQIEVGTIQHVDDAGHGWLRISRLVCIGYRCTAAGSPQASICVPTRSLRSSRPRSVRFGYLAARAATWPWQEMATSRTRRNGLE